MMCAAFLLGFLCTLLPACLHACLSAFSPTHFACLLEIFLAWLLAALFPWVQAKYVAQLVQLRSQQGMRKGKAGLSLLGNQGVQLHAEGANSKREEQLQTTCARWETKLGIQLGE